MTNPNVVQPAIAAASTTNDVIRAMADDENLRKAVLGAFEDVIGSKSAIGSKTLWVSVLVPVITALMLHFGFKPDAEVPLEIATSLFGAVMFGMRLITKGGPVTSVLPATTGAAP